MKITRTSGTARAGSIKKTKKTKGGFDKLVTDSNPPTGQTSAPTSLSDVGALLAVQAVGQKGRGNGRARAHEILDALSDLQLDVLSGKSPTSLQRLTKLATDESAPEKDEDLQGALDEIDLRAAVELAKSKQKGQSR